MDSSDPKQLFDAALDQLIESLLDADKKVQNVASTLLKLQEAIEDDSSTAAIVAGLTKKHQTEIEQFKIAVNNAVNRYEEDFAKIAEEYKTINNAYQAYQALLKQENSIKKIDRTLNNLAGLVVTKEEVSVSALNTRGENIRMEFEIDRLRLQKDALKKELADEKIRCEQHAKNYERTKEIADKRGEALRAAKVADPSTESPPQVATRKSSLMSFKDMLAIGPSTKNTPATNLEKGGTIRNLRRLFGRGQNPDTAMTDTSEQDSPPAALGTPFHSPKKSDPRTSTPLPTVSKTTTPHSRLVAASLRPTSGSFDPIQPQSVHSILSKGMLTSPTRQPVPDPRIPQHSPGEALHDPRHNLAYFLSRQGNGVGVYRSPELAATMLNLDDTLKRPAPATKSPQRRVRARQDSDESMYEADTEGIRVPRRRQQSSRIPNPKGKAVESSDLSPGDDMDTAAVSTDITPEEAADRRRIGDMPPLLAAGRRLWPGPPVIPNNDANTWAREIFTAIEMPLNWTDEANNALLDYLNVTDRASFKPRAQTILDSPCCLTNRKLRTKVFPHSNTDRCDDCKKLNKVCIGFKRYLEGTEAGPIPKRKDEPRMGFMRNSNGYYWEGYHRPARDSGNDGGNDGSEGSSTAPAGV